MGFRSNRRGDPLHNPLLSGTSAMGSKNQFVGHESTDKFCVDHQTMDIFFQRALTIGLKERASPSGYLGLTEKPDC